MTKLSTLLAAILAVVVPLAHAETWRDYIDVTTTEFTGGIHLNGKLKEQGGTEDRYNVSILASVHKKTGQLAGAGFFVNNTYYAKRWRRWDTAATSQAEPLEISTDRGETKLCSSRGCFFEETVTIIAPLTVFRKAVTEPIRIRMRGEGGAEFIFQIDPREAKALLEAIEETAAAQRAGN